MFNHPPKLLLVVNIPEFFLSHRLPIALAAKAEGYEVHVATAEGSAVKKIQEYGLHHHVIPFARSGQNPLPELRTLYAVIRLFRNLSPDLVHLITIKPCLYGGLAARLSKVDALVFAVSGLGTVFLTSSVIGRLREWMVKHLYAVAFKHNNSAVILQNPDDRDTLIQTGALRPSVTRMIRGSGVDLNKYACLPEPTGRPIVVMASRLLKDKGVFEFVEAAEELRRRGVDVEMRLVGARDPDNTTSVSERDVQQWEQIHSLRLMGYRSDIAAQYAAANIVCLPSYREGLPKGLVEAASCGRAVVTTDVPGCRDAITPGVTGLLVPAKNALALADAIQSLVEQPEIRRKMGKAGRRLAETSFAIEKIVEQHIQIYQELLEK